jgi:hypothetical protein
LNTSSDTSNQPNRLYGSISHGGAGLINKNQRSPQWHSPVYMGGVHSGAGLDIFIRSSWDDVFPKTFDGQVIVKSLELAGCGANPFADCNTCPPPYLPECQQP